MKPTEILSAEHRVILQVLDCVEKIAARAQAQGDLNEDDARQAIAFLRNFADRCHHGKEEAHLFPALEAKGLPRHAGPTGVMLHEHELGRSFLRAMEGSLAAAAAGDAEARPAFVSAAGGYVDLLREHIEKEDHCLFGMADEMLAPADQQTLLEAFERVEAEHPAGMHEEYLRVADELARRYGVAGTRAASCGGCCGHH